MPGSLPASSRATRQPASAASMQTYRAPQTQPPFGLEYDMQSGATQNQTTFAPFAVLTHQCIPVCCAPTMTTPAHHVPVNGWAPFPAPCAGVPPGVQLIPCCDGTGNHGAAPSAPRHFYGRPTPMGIAPYHHHCAQYQAAAATHRLPPPPASISMPMQSALYQQQQMQQQQQQMQQQASMYHHHHQQQQAAHQYHSHQMTLPPPPPQQQMYHQPPMVQQRPPAHQQQSSAEELRTEAAAASMHANMSFLSSQQAAAYQQQSMHHAAASVAGQPLLLQPVPSEFITGTFPHYRPVASSRQRYRTYPPMATATPYSGYLLHFLAMLGRPATVVSAMLPQHRAGLQHDDFTELDSYEALLNLAERLGEVKSRGLSRSDIERLHCYRYEASSATVADGSEESSTATHLDQTSCVVCLCDFEAKELVRSLPCLHEFHARCVDKWLKMNRTCPLCRADVTEPTKMEVE